MPRDTPWRARCWFAIASALLIHAGVVAQGSQDNDFDAVLKRGFALHQQARFTEAIPVLEHARQLAPGDYFANLLLGIDLLRVGKAAEAVPRLELAARTRPHEEIPEDYLGEAEASLGHYARAAVAYRSAVDQSHQSEESLEAWAGFALERFRQIGAGMRASAEGLAALRRLQAVAAKPASSPACGGSIPALESKLAGTRHSPAAMQSEVAYHLSLCYAVEAGAAAQRIQVTAGDPATIHRLRGDVLLRLKSDPAGAEVEYRQAIALRSNDPSLLERLAEAQLSNGEMDAARVSAQAALAIDAHRVEAMRTLVSLSMSTRDYEQALVWARQLTRDAPGDESAQIELSRALAQTSHPAEALDHLAPMLAAGYPDEKGALHSLEARLLRQLGRDAEAAKAAAEARRLSDAFQSANKNTVSETPDENN